MNTNPNEARASFYEACGKELRKAHPGLVEDEMPGLYGDGIDDAIDAAWKVTQAALALATPSAAVGEGVPVAELGIGAKPDGLGSRMSFTRLLDGSKSLPAGKHLLYTTPTKPGHMAESVVAAMEHLPADRAATRHELIRAFTLTNPGHMVVPDGMVLVTQEDGNNYCRILRLLGMEEEGDPVASVEAMLNATQGGKGEG